MPEARSVSVFLRAFTAQYQQAMTKASATMRGFGASAEKVGSNWNALGKRTQVAGREISRVGTTLTRNVSLPLAAAGGLAIKTAIDFESAFTGVRKTIDATEAQYRQLERGIQEMAERLPASVEEISAVAEAAGQLGVKRQNILGFTETMIDLGEATNLTADMAATSLARLANITKMPQDEFDRLGATIVDLGNKGASTEAEITEMSLRIAGAGATVGLTEAQIVGFAAALSDVGIRAEAGGSAISRVFITMANEVAKGKQGLTDFAEVAGVSSAEFKKQFETDAAGATVAFVEGLARMKKEGVNVFAVLEKLGLNEIRVRDALLRSAGASDKFARAQKVANNAWEENLALSTEADKRYATNAAKIEMMKNQWRNILATFGRDLMPVLKDVMKALSEAAKWFSNLTEEQRKNIIKWAGIAIAVGPVIRLFGALTTSIGTIIRGGGAAVKILGKLATIGAGGPLTAPKPGGTPPAVPPAVLGSWKLLAARMGAIGAVAGTTKVALDQWLRVQKETINANNLHAQSVQDSHFLMVQLGKSVEAGTMSMEQFERQASGLIAVEGQSAQETAELAQRFAQLRASILANTRVINGQRYSVQGLIRDLNNIPREVMIQIKSVTQVSGADPNFNKPLPGRASGGPVSAGHSYLVGERGPEVLTMGRMSGHVTPNAKVINLNGNIVVPINHVQNGSDPTLYGEQVARALRQHLLKVGA